MTENRKVARNWTIDPDVSSMVDELANSKGLKSSAFINDILRNNLCPNPELEKERVRLLIKEQELLIKEDNDKLKSLKDRLENIDTKQKQDKEDKELRKSTLSKEEIKLLNAWLTSHKKIDDEVKEKRYEIFKKNFKRPDLTLEDYNQLADDYYNEEYDKLKKEFMSKHTKEKWDKERVKDPMMVPYEQYINNQIYIKWNKNKEVKNENRK